LIRLRPGTKERNGKEIKALLWVLGTMAYLMPVACAASVHGVVIMLGSGLTVTVYFHWVRTRLARCADDELYWVSNSWAIGTGIYLVFDRLVYMSPTMHGSPLTSILSGFGGLSVGAILTLVEVVFFVLGFTGARRSASNGNQPEALSRTVWRDKLNHPGCVSLTLSTLLVALVSVFLNSRTREGVLDAAVDMSIAMPPVAGIFDLAAWTWAALLLVANCISMVFGLVHIIRKSRVGPSRLLEV
jgi:hypothetical protein